MPRKPTVQTCRKHHDRQCFFCEESTYAVLHAHRLVPGEQGGVYAWLNLLTVCANCHSKIHTGLINIKGRFLSTAGYVILYEEGGVEKIKRE